LENKRPLNKKGQRDGCWVTYYGCGSWWKAHYVNGVELGFSKYWYSDSSKIIQNEYYAR